MTFLINLTLLITMTSSLHAGVMKDMLKFYNGFGGVSNLSKGSAFNDQTGGHYTGGNMFVRTPVRSQPLVNMRMPGYSMGCGGINAWTGGLSYINKEGLRSMFESIVSNLPSYAFMLAVETYAPQIHTIMHQLNKLAADFNRMNINSCEAASAIAGAAWPRSDLGSQAACRMNASGSGALSDWVGARHDCGGTQRDTHLSRANKDILVGDFNLAWKILEKHDFLKSGSTNLSFPGVKPLSATEYQTLKEIFMTLSGTIINRKLIDGTEEHITLPSKADKEEFIRVLMQGGSLTYYKCDEGTRCLHPTESKTELTAGDALQEKVASILEDISTKIRNDTGSQEISASEIALINATHLPIYKILNVSVAYNKGRSPVNIQEYAELIAFDVTYKYINDVLDLFQDGINQLRAIQFTDVQTQPFMEGIRKARGHLNALRGSAFARMDLMLGFVQKTQMIERQIHSMIGSLTNEYGA